MTSRVEPQGYEALHAREAAEEKLEQVRSNWTYVRALTAKLKEIRESNHFAEKIWEAFHQ